MIILAPLCTYAYFHTHSPSHSKPGLSNLNRWCPSYGIVKNRGLYLEKGKVTVSEKRGVSCNGSEQLKTIAPREEEEDDGSNIVQFLLWVTEGVYIVWLFLLPYAPGDPAWAISSDTVKSLLGLSLNFFFILPLSNSVGIHVMEAPILHPVAEGLFNFVIGWTGMFAPLLFTDCKRNRFKGSLDILWGCQMFLTNAFLIPYMAIRLKKANPKDIPNERSKLGNVMTSGAPVVGLVCGITCLGSILWALYGRADGNYGALSDRWDYLIGYLGSERLAYAFVWDILLYTIFQPWLIGANLENVQESKVGLLSNLRFIPVLGLVAYCLSLNVEKDV